MKDQGDRQEADHRLYQPLRPDFYFGLDVIKAAFPEAKIIARLAPSKTSMRPKTVKLPTGGPILKDNAPKP